MIWLLMMLAETANGVVPESLFISRKEYKGCLTGQAMALEPSEASVDDIFAAAKTSCSKEWGDEYNEIVHYFQNRPPSPTGKNPETIALEMISDQEDLVKGDIRLDILKLRAAKRRP